MIVEFIQEFHEESYILIFHVDDTQSTFFFGSASWPPSSKASTSSVDFSFAPQASFSEFINLLDNCRWNQEATHIKCGES